ncbi:unnamed protein product [Pseudo-nitzschia multistriata]|uniref:Uncharacterized protein n=1 Tax=Pseudo-nitzschia multistriata TaxID=183589 RepID=A0A448ZHQ3_9STRA|nr:unnamed protein product [Pseudo-nitzschia multistriata]
MYKQKRDEVEFKDFPVDLDVRSFFDTQDGTQDGTKDRAKTKTKRAFVNFLPAEIKMCRYANSLTTITFYEGDYRKIRKDLERRVNNVLEANPWLGGRLAVKPGDDQLRLWYDPTGVDLPPDIYTCYEPGIIPLKRTTQYAQYKDCLADHDVVVPRSHELVGKNRPLWQVTVVPDIVEQNERFAIVVSQSQMIGDAYTYYQIFHMLFNSRNNTMEVLVNTAPVEKLNPIRRADVQHYVEEHMGLQEASYVKKSNSNVIDEVYDMVSFHKKQAMMFTVSESWLKTRTEKCIADKRERDKSEFIAKFCEAADGNHDGNITPEPRRRTSFLSTRMKSSRSFSEVLPDKTGDGKEEPSAMATRKAAMAAWESSINDRDRFDDIDPTDVLLSWWFCISNADIGLYPHHLRKSLAVLSDTDAGNYNTPIPFRKADYQTPHQIHESINTGKRVGSEQSQRPLPRITTHYSFAMGVDWDKLYSDLMPRGSGTGDQTEPSNPGGNEDGSIDGNSDGFVQDLHVPLFTDTDINAMPARKDACLIFTARAGKDHPGGRTIGMFLVASRAVCERVSACGIVDRGASSSTMAGITESGRGGPVVDFGPGTSPRKVGVVASDRQ